MQNIHKSMRYYKPKLVEIFFLHQMTTKDLVLRAAGTNKQEHCFSEENFRIFFSVH
jgi:hypothetical protein